jgi:GxxExxY protein
VKVSFGETTSPEIERVATEIVDAAFKIHSKLGPGLLESAYHALMVCELTKRGLRVRKEVELPVVYEEVRIDLGYRLDLIVEERDRRAESG